VVYTKATVNFGGKREKTRGPRGSAPGLRFVEIVSRVRGVMRVRVIKPSARGLCE